MQKQKNILAVHDISCVGRCSLTVALPIISALGAECRLLPTALLSTHTGGFSGFTYLDLSDEMRKIIAAWKPLNLSFDAVYSGFLANAGQVEILQALIAEYKTKSNSIIIDPVMGDNGALYKVYDNAFVQKIKTLIPLADVLIPNITEACLLTDTPYIDGVLTQDYIQNLITKLVASGAKNIVITGVSFNTAKLGVAVYGADTKKISYYFTDKISGYYHGTGDIFGSVFSAAYVNGSALHDAAAKAADFVVKSILNTPNDADPKYGVNFEKNFI